jgi:N-acylneuraminate cytidylyltransferase/CMP-N,N'-diacetyllegionaminic acid synthase
MDKTGEILIVIPARGGSKRLPRKNVLPLAGKPLICWSIEAALESRINARIMVTSDDEEILNIAKQYRSQGVIVYKRSAELASDNATTADVLINAVEVQRLEGADPQSLVLLQPTSPLRNAQDICAAIDVYHQNGSQETVVSVCEVDHPSAWVGFVEKDSILTGVDLSKPRSQDYVKEYRLNGAVYVFHVNHLLCSGSIFTERLFASKMPRSRSLDIDEEIDFYVCEALINDS